MFLLQDRHLSLPLSQLSVLSSRSVDDITVPSLTLSWLNCCILTRFKVIRSKKGPPWCCGLLLLPSSHFPRPIRPALQLGRLPRMRYLFYPKLLSVTVSEFKGPNAAVTMRAFLKSPRYLKIRMKYEMSERIEAMCHWGLELDPRAGQRVDQNLWQVDNFREPPVPRRQWGFDGVIPS